MRGSRLLCPPEQGPGSPVIGEVGCPPSRQLSTSCVLWGAVDREQGRDSPPGRLLRKGLSSLCLCGGPTAPGQALLLIDRGKAVGDILGRGGRVGPGDPASYPPRLSKV